MVMHTTTSCPSCNGQGHKAKTHCDQCTNGAKEVDRKINYTVLPDSKDGDVVRLPGQGGEGTNGAPNGNLYLKYRMTLPKAEELSEEQIELLKEIK